MTKPQALLTLMVATTNPGKLREIKTLFADLPFQIVIPPPLAPIAETGTTFMENALIKAQTVAQLTGTLTLAEDSGLVVDALGGHPGVYSRRYGTTDGERNQKLLQELINVPDAKRSARFVCAAVIYNPETHHPYSSQGQVEGLITDKPLGQNGFGYDPIFFSLELGKTFAEVSEAEKNQVSHRARALAALKTKYSSEGHIGW